MLLKFTTSDMLNSELVDAQTGELVYTIVSRASFVRGKDDEIIDVESRITEIINANGEIVAEIEWAGKEKRQIGAIRILEETSLKLSDLFDGCGSVLRIADTLCVPSRLDFMWTATRGSITLTNVDTNELEGKLHESCVQIGDHLLRPHIPGIGNNYLEFSDQPESVLLELLVDYVLMDIMRRARFNLKKYEFSQQTRRYSLDRGKDIIQDALLSKLSIGRKFRRGTI